MKDWGHIAIVTLLRIGVLLSIAIIMAGVATTFVHHPEYASSRPSLGALTSPASHYPNTMAGVIHGMLHGREQAIIMAGLLVLIATPVARVALSIVVFTVARERLYAAITAAVLAILLISFGVGLVTG